MIAAKREGQLHPSCIRSEPKLFTVLLCVGVGRWKREVTDFLPRGRPLESRPA